MVWDEETIRLLKDLWTQGLSTAEIGRRLAVSKNAIVGKAHRLELEARPSPIRRDGVKPATDHPPPCPRTAGPTLPPLASADLQPMVATELAQSARSMTTISTVNIRPLRPATTTPPPAVDRTSAAPPASRTVMPPAPFQSRRPVPSCCWPIGEPGTRTFRFCDDLSLPGKPYCDEHAKLAYVKVRDRKEDAA
jgi:GcrA cell cycle regulator